jgi:hypothetical protein
MRGTSEPIPIAAPDHSSIAYSRSSNKFSMRVKLSENALQNQPVQKDFSLCSK